MKKSVESGLWILLILAATIWAYLPLARSGFAGLDDAFYVVENPVVREGLTGPGTLWAFTTFHAANWHPVTWLSHMLDVSLFGIDPGMHHRVNVGFHAANSILLLFVLIRLTGSVRRSGLVAALFAMHPLHVESVAWISERKELLCAFFGFLAIGAWGRYAERPSLRRYLFVVLWFALGLMSKPMLVTLPLLLLLVDHWPLRRTASVPFPRLLSEKVPLFLLSAASSLVTLIAQDRGTAIVSLAKAPFPMRAANALASYGGYLRNTLWPDSLSVFYPHPATIPGRPLPIAEAVASLVLLSGAGYLAWRWRRERPWMATGFLWFLLSLVPVIGLVQVGAQAMADRYTYLPLVGVFIAFSWGAAELWRSTKLPPPGFCVACLALVASCTAASRVQANYWKDDLSLFRRAIETTADNWMAHLNVGSILAKSGDLPGGIGHFREAIRIKPDYAEAYANMGSALIDLGRPSEAVEWARKSVRLKPDFPEARNTLGLAIESSGGDRDEAARQYREAIRLSPDYAEAYNNLGALYGRKGDPVVAIRYFRDAIRADPRHVEAWINLGVAFRNLGMTADSERSFRAAIGIDPANARALREIESAGRP